MKKMTRYAAIGVISASLIGAVVCCFGYAAGLRINTTKSIPVGLTYRKLKNQSIPLSTPYAT
ncbi:hypothetical protein NNE25_22080 [Escherichia coli]|uniref:hypothetical protein n=1 Tax=Escherichia coli TaxID=562 RepID=UPI00241EF7C0|nr:hypothetical protein [Escherichia coli]MDG5515597.1 hypothetical protein [Escherichia coli]